MRHQIPPSPPSPEEAERLERLFSSTPAVPAFYIRLARRERIQKVKDQVLGAFLSVLVAFIALGFYALISALIDYARSYYR
jgi:hypothetical protein